MKILILVLVTIGQAAIALPTVCSGRDVSFKPVHLYLYSSVRGATGLILVDGKRVKFGHLDCSTYKKSSAYLYCTSKGVRGAGYSVLVGRAPGATRTEAEVSRVDAIGATPYADLVCTPANPM